MLSKLRLEEKIGSPPNYPDLLAVVCREESRRTERKLRYRKQVKSQVVTVETPVVEKKQQVSKEVIQLQQRFVELEKQINIRSNPGDSNRVRRSFCYRCGSEGHYATECENAVNKCLVEERAKARKNSIVREKTGRCCC